MKKVYFDAQMGAAGDMIAAALADLLENPEEAMQEFNEAIKGSGLEDVVAEVAEHFSQGVKGEEFNVNVDEESRDYPHEHFEHHPHEHDDWDHDHRDHYHFDDHDHDHWDHHHFDEDHHHDRFDHRHYDDHHRCCDHHHYDDHDHFHDHHRHDHPHFDEHFHGKHWEGRHPHEHRCCEHHGPYDHRRPPRAHFDDRCCHDRFWRVGPMRDKCKRGPHMEGPACPPIELHFHLHLGETIVEERKRCKHHKHKHHHRHCHHKHHKDLKKEAVKKETPKAKGATNKKTISMSHPKDHLDA